MASGELGGQQPPTAGELREFSNLAFWKQVQKNPLSHMNVAKNKVNWKLIEKLGLRVSAIPRGDVTDGG